MFSQPELTYFIITSCLLIIAPGPDIVFLITQSVRHGPKAGIFTALGLASGNLIHTAAAALGISTVFQNSVTAFSILKYLGVCYLLYLAFQVFTNADSHDDLQFDSCKKGISFFIRGFLMNVLNPKVALFFLAFIPQFVSIGSINIGLEMLFYGVLFTSLVIIIFGSIGLFAGKLYKRAPTGLITHQFFRLLIGSIFISLAVRLFLLQP
tara:strand:+ start:128782 stop:129408 length:627 start_codon:yes stop_codon:yes gene_type:complete